MVEVLRHGKLPEEKEWQFECSHCHCIFKIKQKEGRVTSDQRDGTFISYNCPECSRACYKDMYPQNSYWNR